LTASNSGLTVSLWASLSLRNGSGPLPSPCEPASEATNCASPFATSPAEMLSQSSSAPSVGDGVALKPFERSASENAMLASAAVPATKASPSIRLAST
jgi:hypothetical protein